ncbi:MAG: serine/threonine-protein kinase [Synechococcales bacterium]|nr:serine/threonine-protein kinase [Synechococcales bacterium]
MNPTESRQQNPDHNSSGKIIGEIIADRYRILTPLGEGGMGITYRTEDLKTGTEVALKTIVLRQSQAFKTLELFEREAKVLAHLDHAKIPKYIDHFQIDSPSNLTFYLVQELAMGKSLADLCEQGWQPTVAEVQAIATQMLDCLIYLQTLTPPVIHRDIKPQNIIRREDGQIMLVDFGSVQDIYHNTVLGGSTVVGTYGYMAPEQFRGHAVLASDLYGLGTTLLFLLTQQSPSDLPQRGLKIDCKKALAHLNLPAPLLTWLERLVEPVPEDRFHSAIDALAVLQGQPEIYKPAPHQRPLRTPIALVQLDDQLVINIPPVWLRTNAAQWLLLLPLSWQLMSLLLFWLVEVGVGWQWAWQYDRLVCLLPLLHQAIGLLFWVWFFRSMASRIRIECTPTSIRLKRWILGKLVRDRTFRWTDASATLVQIKTPLSLRRDRPITVCQLRGDRFGFWLTEAEKAWLMHEVNIWNGWDER